MTDKQINKIGELSIKNNIIIYLYLIWIIIIFAQDAIRFIFKHEILLYIDEIFGLLLILFTIFLSWKKNSFYFDKTGKYSLLLLIYIITLEILQSSDISRSILYVAYIFKYYSVYFITSNLNITFSKILWVLRKISVLYLVILTIGFIDFFTNGQISNILGYESYVRNGLYRLKSIFYHPFAMGWLSAAFSGIYFFKYFILDKKLSSLIIFIVSVLCLVLTDSRKSMFGLAIASAIALYYYMKAKKLKLYKNKFIISTFICLIVIVSLITPQIIEKLEYTKTEYVDSEDAARITLITTGFKIMLDNFPIGTGVGTFASIGSLRPYSPLYSEYGLSQIYGITIDNPKFINDVLWASIMAELGFIGLVLYLFIFINMIHTILKFIKININDNRKSFLLVICLFLLIEAFIETFASSIMSVYVTTAIIFGIIGMTVKLINTPSTTKNIQKAL